MVTVGWNTDRTDVDLHVTEPDGGKCYYRRRKTPSGGWISHDVTTGFGPETYVAQRAPEGRFAVAVSYFASDGLRTGTRTRVWATVHRNWGRPDATVERRSVLLEQDRAVHAVIDIER